MFDMPVPSDRGSAITAVVADGQKNEHGSVNEANHFHAAWTVDSIQALLGDSGLVQTHAEMGDTKLPVFPDEGKWPLNLIARGRKPA